MDTACGTVNVLYLQHAEDFGGAERQAAVLIPLLGRHGVRVTPLVGPGERIARWLEAEGVHDYILSDHFPAGWATRVTRRRQIVRFPELVASMRRLVEQADKVVVERRIEVILASLSFSWLLSGVLGRRHGLPTVWRLGGCRLTPFERALLGWVARHWRPSVAVANAGAVAEVHRPLIPAPIRVLYNGVDLARFAPGAHGAAYRADVPAGRPVAGFVGRLAPEKNPEGLLDLAGHLRRLAEGSLLLVAGDSPRLGDLVRQAAERGLEGTVRFLGFLEDVERFYASCDVIVLPSRSEGCPNVLLEAMAMGVPVVATRVGGVPEVVDDGVEGFLVGEGDLLAMAEAVVRLFRSPTLRGAMGRAGRLKVEARFDRNAAARRLADLLRGLARPAGR